MFKLDLRNYACPYFEKRYDISVEAEFDMQADEVISFKHNNVEITDPRMMIDILANFNVTTIHPAIHYWNNQFYSSRKKAKSYDNMFWHG